MFLVRPKQRAYAAERIQQLVGIQYNRLMKSDVNRILMSVGTHF
jgi:hypothetical protein